jgi:hypothetical protein
MEKIERISDTEIFVDGMKYIRDVFKSPRPEFKAGDWVKKFSDGGISRIKEIEGIEGNNLRYNDGCYHQEFKGYIRHAASEEVAQHLKKICDEKYIGKKVKCLSDGCDYIPHVFDYYDYHTDSLWYDDSHRYAIKIYESGKFAEIIPDKKKLPKTKEELRKIVISAMTAPDGTNIEDFLYDYED